MAFFEALGKKISETSQEVVQKTKDTAEILKLNSMISDEENQLKEYYIELAKAYYEANKNSIPEEYASYFANIAEKHANIANLNDQINKVKGLFPCPNCGASLPSDALFCSSCGTKIEKPEEPVPVAEEATDVKRCTKCGEPIQEGFAFCINCGTKVEQPSEEITEETPKENE